MANQFNWSLGHEGKGNVYDDGSISTWDTDETRSPHHYEIGQQDEKIPRFHFYIEPNGGLWDGGTTFNNQTPHTDDQVVQQITQQHPAIWDGRNEFGVDWDAEDYPEERVEMPGGGYGHAEDLMNMGTWHEGSVFEKLASEGWADFHTEFKIPRGVRKQLRRWVDRLKWPDNHEKHDAREYHITVLDMDEYDEDFAKWARKEVQGKELHFKSTGMQMFNDFVVVRLECPEWEELASRWTEEADKRGLEPHKFPGGPKAHVSVGRSYDKKWPQGIPNPHIKFRTRMFNIKRNGLWHESMAIDPEYVQKWHEPSTGWGSQKRYLYHGRQEHPDSVRANGIEGGWSEYHTIPSVYLTSNQGLAEHFAQNPGSEHTYYEEEGEEPEQGQWVYQIDPTKLDPNLIEADEWNVQDPYPEGHEYYGEGHSMTPEMLQHVADPDVTQHQWDTGYPLAYRGTIPPEAIVDHYQMVNGEPQEWNSDLEATAKVSKWHISIPVSQEWYEEPRNQQPLYHGTSMANARRILAEGLKPWDDPSVDQKWGNEFEHEWAEPRPGHVYLAQSPSRAQGAATDKGFEGEHHWDEDSEYEDERHPDDGKSVVLKIDPRHLDPANMNPDEDASGKLQQNPWEEYDPYFDEDAEEPEHKTLGEWAENTGWGNDTAESEKQIDRFGTMAYRGTIPPQAISVHSILEPEQIPGQYGITREIWKPANELPSLGFTMPPNTAAVDENGMEILEPWSWGNWGKGFVNAHNGELMTWNTTPAESKDPALANHPLRFTVGSPHHGDISEWLATKMEKEGIPPEQWDQERDYHSPITIAPNGQYTHSRGLNSPIGASHVSPPDGEEYRFQEEYTPLRYIDDPDVWKAQNGGGSQFGHAPFVSSEREPHEDLAAWLQSFDIEPATAPSPHHTDADQFQPQIVAPVVQTPHIDPPKKPYKPYNWAEEGWEESPMNMTAAADPEWWDKYVAENPYAYHFTFPDAIPTIQDRGLVPWDAPLQDAPGTAYTGDLKPRPGHVYLTPNPKRSEGAGGDPNRTHVVKVDLRQLDPERVNPDEDAGIGRWKQWQQIPGYDHLIDPYTPHRRPMFPGSYDGPLNPYPSMGGWAEGFNLDHPQMVQDSLRSEDPTFAYKGAIPPEAIAYAGPTQHMGHTHQCPSCGATIDGQICGECGYNPTHPNNDYDKAKGQWYDRAWSHPEDQPRPLEPMHWGPDDGAHDISLASTRSVNASTESTGQERRWDVGLRRGRGWSWGPSDDLS